MNLSTLEVSVVMPCLNEAQTLETCIRKAQKAIVEHGLAGEVIVADNGSTDDSPQIAERCGACLVPVPQKGYGAALLAGITAARGKYVIMGDSDDSYDFLQLFAFVEKLRQGQDLVMGCRFPRGGGMILPGAMPWLHRWLGNPALTAIGRIFFKVPVSDFYCGYRAFRRDALDWKSFRTTGMEFAYEMLVKSTFHQLKISEIPITLHKDGRMRRSHLRSWRDGWRTLRFMLLYSPRWLFLIPGLVLFFLGAISGGILLTGPVTVGSVQFAGNTLLVSSMVLLIGFQLVSFAMFAKIFAISEGLLPEDPRIEKICQVITLEVGIASGALLSLAGLGLLVWGVLFWRNHDFGMLSYADTLRLVIPGVTALTLGMGVIFSSFFISILGLRRK